MMKIHPFRFHHCIHLHSTLRHHNNHHHLHRHTNHHLPHNLHHNNHHPLHLEDHRQVASASILLAKHWQESFLLSYFAPAVYLHIVAGLHNVGDVSLGVHLLAV